MRTAYIVALSVPAEEFRERLAGIPGARLVQELPRGRVVVVLASPEPRGALAALHGVTAVEEDRPEHLARPRGRSAP